jgi:hypothetical protein
MLAPSLPWFDWWRRAASLSWAQLDGLAALNDPRRWRSAVLDDWRMLATDCMKSPQFLALMRLHLTLLTQPMVIKAAQMMAPSVR